MPRRVISLFVCAAICIGICTGCQGKNGVSGKKERVLEGRLTEMPCYALDENATADQMRKAALKAHYDGLTVQWYTDKNFSYTKIGPLEGERFSYNTREIYCGLPYTMGDTSLLHWLQYYDFKTGKMKEGFTNDISNRLGNACTESVKWAWSVVSPEQAWDFPINLTPKNGAVPVGDYKIDPELLRYDTVSTDDICRQNGEKIIYKAYAATLPADLVVSYPFNHCMMVNKKPEVVYDRSGEIDPDKSYLTIEDQRSGVLHNTPLYLKFKSDGKFYHYSGRTEARIPFKSLFKEGYIPFTCEQFLGKKPYVKAEAHSSLTEKPETYAEIECSRVISNYNIVCLYVDITDKSGKNIHSDTVLRCIPYERKSLDKHRDKQLYLEFPLNDIYNSVLKKSTIKQKMTAGEQYRIKISAMVSTGEVFEVIDETVVYNK